MENCCINILGRFSHNEDLKTGIIVDETGEFKIFMEQANGVHFALRKNLNSGNEIIFPIGELNESMEYKFRILKPSVIFLQKNDCENFTLETIINSQIDGCISLCSEEETPIYYAPETNTK